jgi:hypothetical protein
VCIWKCLKKTPCSYLKQEKKVIISFLSYKIGKQESRTGLAGGREEGTIELVPVKGEMWLGKGVGLLIWYKYCVCMVCKYKHNTY